MFRQILLAYDGSDGSSKALKLAADLVKGNTEVHLTVVNVYDEKIETRRVDIAGDSPSAPHGYLIEGMPPPPVTLGFTQTEYSTQSIITNSVDNIFSEAKSQLDPLPANYRVLEGSPAESICTFAKEINADLIIVGSSGKSGIKGLLLGNNTEKVSRMAHCHVLIAK